MDYVIEDCEKDNFLSHSLNTMKRSDYTKRTKKNGNLYIKRKTDYKLSEIVLFHPKVHTEIFPITSGLQLPIKVRSVSPIDLGCFLLQSLRT